MSLNSEDDNTSILYSHKWKPISGKTVDLIVSNDPWYNNLDNNIKHEYKVNNERPTDFFGVILMIITLILIIYYVSLGYSNLFT